MTEISIKVCYLEGADIGIPLPKYETSGAAAMDLCVNFDLDMRDGGRILRRGERGLFPTGLSIEIPQGFEAQIRPRSGLAIKHGISLVNTPGTIDADYRGPLGVILINHGTKDFHVAHGDRIAQIIFAPVLRVKWISVDALNKTQRGSGGFGSTG